MAGKNFDFQPRVQTAGTRSDAGGDDTEFDRATEIEEEESYYYEEETIQIRAEDEDSDDFGGFYMPTIA